MIKLVVDTNILVSANLSDDGLEALIVSLALNRRIQFYVSEPILEEYQRVLRYPRLKFDMREVGQFLTRLRRSCVLVRPLYTVSVSPDDSDNRFLEYAEAANADFLVTGNKRHSPKRWKETEVVNARELLGKIGSTFLK
jgi:putative PIN family toxin of toxin-antitoxin system